MPLSLVSGPDEARPPVSGLRGHRVSPAACCPRPLDPRCEVETPKLLAHASRPVSPDRVCRCRSRSLAVLSQQHPDPGCAPMAPSAAPGLGLVSQSQTVTLAGRNQVHRSARTRSDDARRRSPRKLGCRRSHEAVGSSPWSSPVPDEPALPAACVGTGDPVRAPRELRAGRTGTRVPGGAPNHRRPSAAVLLAPDTRAACVQAPSASPQHAAPPGAWGPGALAPAVCIRMALVG